MLLANKTSLHLISAIFVILLPLISTDDNNTTTYECTEASDCSQCLRIPNCAWCADPARLKKSHLDYDSPRCQPRIYLEANNCAPIVNRPKPRVENDTTLNSNDNNTSKSLPEFSPAQVSVEAPIGEPVQIQMRYVDPKDKPLDFYILMDDSSSMRQYKNAFVREATSLVTALGSEDISGGNVQLGYGSYVDKPLDPFSRPENIDGENNFIKDKKFVSNPIEPIHLFKHIVSITNDTEHFRKTINLTANTNSANKDDPEGGLDALVQVIACDTDIGWRNDTTRLIMIATDGPMQLAGYGRLAGILRPNDLQCHLDDPDFLIQQDFPSLNQLHRLIAEKQVNIIFAVTQAMIPFYKKIQSRIPRVTVANINASDIVSFTQKTYRSIKVKVVVDIEHSQGITNEDYSITYDVNCTKAEVPGKHGHTCVNVSHVHHLFFNFSLTLKPSICDRSTEEKYIKIKREGSSKFMRIDLHPVCDCPCQLEAHRSEEKPSENCSGNGTEVCGACECFSTHQGKLCQCDKSKSKGNPETIAQCAQGGIVCSGRGNCTCGVCVCHDEQRYQGPFCEFDQHDCINIQGTEACSGHGICYQAKCNCEHGWTGDFCNCKSSTASCKEPGSDKVCSGGGSTCSCPAGTSSVLEVSKSCIECEPGRKGKFCEYCADDENDCKAGMHKPAACTDPGIHDLISCYYSFSKASSNPDHASILNDCNFKHNSKSLWFFNKIIPQSRSSTDQNLTTFDCSYTDGRCTVHYYYRYNDDNNVIIYLGFQECPLDMFWIIVGVAGAIVFIGVLTLLLWKYLTNRWDRKDYEKFQQEISNAQWSQENNPLYDNPLTNVENPVFRRSVLRPASWLPKRFSKVE